MIARVAGKPGVMERVSMIDAFKNFSQFHGDIEVRASSISKLLDDCDEPLESLKGVPWVLSTEDVDSYGDIVTLSGWDTRRFAHNPVVLWSHNHNLPLIGLMSETAVTATDFRGLIDFVDMGCDSFTDGILRRIKSKALKAGSVGFQPTKWEFIEQKVGGATEIVGIRFLEKELHEFSICNVPANPFSLSLGKSIVDLEAQEHDGPASDKPDGKEKGTQGPHGALGKFLGKGV